jgi:hypothetical protein
MQSITAFFYLYKSILVILKKYFSFYSFGSYQLILIRSPLTNQEDCIIIELTISIRKVESMQEAMAYCWSFSNCLVPSGVSLAFLACFSIDHNTLSNLPEYYKFPPFHRVKTGSAANRLFRWWNMVDFCMHLPNARIITALLIDFHTTMEPWSYHPVSLYK